MRDHHGFVSGRVQGVGFRYFVTRCARAAGIAGYVRNLRDGRVEFRLQGDADAVDTVLAQIRRGPAHARVDDVELCQIEDDERYGDFSVR
jgi:acylphosphatase